MSAAVDHVLSSDLAKGSTWAKYSVCAEALREAPHDPAVVGRTLRLYFHYATPFGASYVSGRDQPDDETGRQVLREALAAAAPLLTTPPSTLNDRVLAFFAWLVECSFAVQQRPTDEQLARVEDLAERVFALVVDDTISDDEKNTEYDLVFRTDVLARWRCWQALRQGPPYADDTVGRVAGYGRFGWPIAPLVVDADFQRWATAELAARGQQQRHPVPEPYDGTTIRYSIADFRNPPPAHEVRGATMVLCLAGMTIEHLARSCVDAIDEGSLPCLEVLLGTGFDINQAIVDDDTGATVLDHAVNKRNVPAVRALVAVGADPDRPSGKGKKRTTPRQRAEASKNKALIAACAAPEARAIAARAALAHELRAAATRVSASTVRLVADALGASYGVDVVLDKLMASAPEHADEVLAVVSDPFDQFVAALLLQAAGLGRPQHHTALHVGDEAVVIAGDLVVDGAITVVGRGRLLVAGRVKASTIVVENDGIVGGSVEATTLLWGDGNDGTLVIGGDLTTPLCVLTDHSLDVGGTSTIAHLHDDPDVATLQRLFVRGVFDGGKTPRPTTAQAKALLLRGAPLLNG